MFHRFHIRLPIFAAACGLVLTTLVFTSLAASGQDDTSKRGRKYKTPPPTARIEVTILRDVNGKPIENAAVIFHSIQGDKDNMELKTNEDGKTIIDVLPIGNTVRLQVIAKGFQTYGEDYKIDKPEMAIEIKMKRPGEQYSIYKPHDGSEVGGAGSAKDKPAAPATDAAPATTPAPDTASPASKPKPDDSTKQPDAQPDQPQSK